MTRRTLTKKNRHMYAIREFDKDGQPLVLGKLIEIAPPEPRRKIEIPFHGETHIELVAPGQIINPKKVLKRLMKKRNHGK